MSQVQLAEVARRSVAELGEFGWNKMISDFEEQETDPVPVWMQQRIRATDLKPVIGWTLPDPIGTGRAAEACSA